MPSDYPVTGDKALILTRETMADSVVMPGDYELHGANPEYWMSLVPAPHFPAADPNAPYWEELRQVVKHQIARHSLDDPSTLNRWPDLWANYTLDDIAKVVKGEYPASLQQQLIETMFKSGVRSDYSAKPFRSVVDYVGTEVRIAYLNSWSIECVGAISFMLKWHIGMPRPEEMAWLIYTGEFNADDGVPQDIIDSILNMKLTNATEFTAYENGSPLHPSWPAMHSSGSSCSFWLPAIVKMSPQQYCEALRLDYGVAFARTVAGVHYPADNLAGLNIGQQIVKDKLPAHLSERYGYDAAAIKTKLERLSFDWADFDPYNCTIAGVSVSERLFHE
jgi:membrane-associated phospholipid phosphatase